MATKPPTSMEYRLSSWDIPVIEDLGQFDDWKRLFQTRTFEPALTVISNMLDDNHHGLLMGWDFQASLVYDNNGFSGFA